ncbi:helicase-associated domain-containing protein [Nocardia sp. NRRL S-836]|uniref:helicase-associated domain-containing protein n=1 Tax=Nocardia sp. NRRL S-836 TaxID=1519492 RepID=UPI0006ADB776|nr:helicase-associated domain-containing protein [Nocardia sp. NRRL S-836]
MPRRTNALATWLQRLDQGEVAVILTHRGDVGDRLLRSLKDLAYQLTDPDSVHHAEDELDQGAVDVLGAIIRLGARAGVDAVCADLGCSSQEFGRAFGELTKRALAWPEGATLREVNSVRAAHARPRLTPRPPAARRRPASPASPAGPAMSTVDGVARLLAHCERENFDARYTGGVATPEIRRVARLLRVTDAVLRLRLELAVEAQLLGLERGHLRPTRHADAWLDAHPGVRLTALVAAWQRMDWRPDPEQARAALRDYAGQAGAELRRSTLAAFSADHAVVDVGELVDELVWARPAVHEARVTAAVVAELEALALVADGALTPLGHAVLHGGDVEAAAVRLMPAATERAVFQADLTAVVDGLPSTALSSTLNLVADLENDDTARVWRLSAGSIRRALDAGLSADEVLLRLGVVAEGPLPQAVEYQVQDVARRHGQLTVTEVACCVRAEDPALLQEIARTRALHPLGLRFLAPTVLASVAPMTETLAALRRAGYAPKGVDGGDRSIVERTRPERAAPRGERGQDRRRPVLDDVELAQLAVRLVEQERQVVGRGTPRTNAARMLRDQNVFLRDEEVQRLASALVDGRPVRIGYASGPRQTETVLITPVKHLDGVLTADCEGGASREFHIEHVRAVRAPGG